MAGSVGDARYGLTELGVNEVAEVGALMCEQ